MIGVDPVSVPSPGHLPSPSPDGFDFQRANRTSQSEQAVPLGGMPRALREAAESCGLDPVAELFNEALRYARDGHLRLAKERLQVLLCMSPDDGEARLVLARIHVAGQRWSEALAALDEAASCGVDVPSTLRRAVEDHLQQQHAAEDEQKTAVRARDQGEVKALRGETRRLRSDNAQLGGRIQELEKEVRRWAWATAGVSGLAIVFVASSLLFGGGSDTPAEVVEEPLAVAEAEAPPPTPVAAVEQAAAPEVPESAPAMVPATPSVADTVALRAGAALEAAGGLDGAELTLSIHGTEATLTGRAVNHKQLKAAESVLAGVDGIETVHAENVALRVRSEGAMHIVQKGETLSHIAYDWYGESTRTKPIEEANKVSSKNLQIGQQLVIPPVD